MTDRINGDPLVIAAARAINELRCGRAVYLPRSDGSEQAQRGVLIVAAETVSFGLIARLEQLAREPGVVLAITAERARTLGLGTSSTPLGSGPLQLRLHPPVSASMVHRLAGVRRLEDQEIPTLPTAPHPAFIVEASDALTASALKLAKHARLLPAVLSIECSAPIPTDVLQISQTEIDRLSHPVVADLERVSEARVPLAGHEDCKLVLFRDARDGSEHVAVVIGDPTITAVPVRLHSACFTGDLLGSLRCDCGDQLRRAVSELAALGGGVLLYLAQEGRGIGLANKLRAYELQDEGLDTLEADQHLGFTVDERTYAAAASILRQLGLTHIQLLTNNLDKIEALEGEGIVVVAGHRLIGPVNRHNARYIQAKRERAGHLMPAIDTDEL